MSDSSSEDEFFKEICQQSARKKHKTSSHDSDDMEKLAAQVREQQEKHDGARKREQIRASRNENSKSEEREKPSIKADMEADMETPKKVIFKHWPKRLRDVENLKNANDPWETWLEKSWLEHKKPKKPTNDLCTKLFQIVCFHSSQFIVEEAFCMLKKVVTGSKMLKHDTSAISPWTRAPTISKKRRRGKGKTARRSSSGKAAAAAAAAGAQSAASSTAASSSSSSSSPWYPKASEILRVLNDYGMDTAAVADAFPKVAFQSQGNDNDGEDAKTANDQPDDAGSGDSEKAFPSFNLRKLLMLLSLVSGYREGEMEDEERAALITTMLHILESSLLQSSVADHAGCLVAAEKVLMSLIVSIEAQMSTPSKQTPKRGGGGAAAAGGGGGGVASIETSSSSSSLQSAVTFLYNIARKVSLEAQVRLLSSIPSASVFLHTLRRTIAIKLLRRCESDEDDDRGDSDHDNMDEKGSGAAENGVGHAELITKANRIFRALTKRWSNAYEKEIPRDKIMHVRIAVQLAACACGNKLDVEDEKREFEALTKALSTLNDSVYLRGRRVSPAEQGLKQCILLHSQQFSNWMARWKLDKFVKFEKEMLRK
eukprot:jgi/Bigna1/88102/estExt_fgenesh1_pg.C_280068